MSDFNDSVYVTFTDSGTPKSFANFTISQNEVYSVPVINSSSNGEFVTGILWDSSDSGDLEYDSSEREDIVFVTNVNRGKVGTYGIYDYEIDIPAKLRSYDSSDESRVYLYYDLN